PELAEALRIVTAETTGVTFGVLMAEMVALRGPIVALVRQHGIDGVGRALARQLGLDPGEDVQSIEGAILEEGIPSSEWGEISRTLARAGSVNGTAGRLAEAALAPKGEARLDAYLRVFLVRKTLEPRADSYLPNVLRRSLPTLCMRLDEERERLVPLVDRRRAALTVRRTRALLALGDAVLSAYARLKADQGVLDFDDLIAKTLSLVTRSDAAWVLYKLDAGIDHILLDEAQDTSSEQWMVLQRLAADLMAGEGARGVARTLFAVGDEKQSIFSFQGAAPEMFDRMRRYFEGRIRESAPSRGEAGAKFRHLPLHLSFRSVPAVLSAVDDVFSLAENFSGLSFDAEQTATQHESWKSELPGRIEIWDTVVAREKSDPKDWRLPVDAPEAHDPPVVLARRIAATVRSWIAPGSLERVHDADGHARPIRAGDLLILVRVRGSLFEALIRGLKNHAVPVAGADRMVLSDHIAVMDLIAAGRAALLREDDLSLACTLKSPLLGLGDDDLLALAPTRRGSLADALDSDPRYAAVAATLEAWRHAARHATPFDFYMLLLAKEQGRKRIAARLGAEADDAVGEFLRLALEHEREGAPSLTRFLASIETIDLSVKRDMEAAGDSVRVMTVHAAKGLEAKIVILADTCGVPTGRHDPKLFRLEPVNAPEGTPPLIAWSTRMADDPPAVSAARGMVRRQALEEHRRLLYVAMTRAEERLIIAGFEDKPTASGTPSRPAGCWYDMILAALQPTLEEMPAHWDAKERILWRGQLWNQGTLPFGGAPADLSDAAPPDWLFRPPAMEVTAAAPLKPSNGLAAADRVGAAERRPDWSPGEPGARREGLLMHTLLQHLPDVAVHRRRAAAARFLAARAGDLPANRQADLIETALGVLAHPDLSGLFGPQSRAEVGVAGRLTRADRTILPVIGQIDRLSIGTDTVLIADFKTGKPLSAEATPPTYVAQLAVYRAILAPLYPGKAIRAMLIWTAGPSLVEIEPARLDAVLQELLAA
ncbi:MAG: double-strand break repair helicase AddA, partial [Methylobacteriaceae bacterium]|nr:double-strand break repair helicase AddA [Methylobacteriaceae bacterium]